jgi:glycosyltransferase 2 family protein
VLLVDRLTAYVCLLALAFCLLPLAGDVPGSLVLGLIAVSALLAAMLALSFWLVRSPRLRRAVPSRLRPWAVEMRQALSWLASDRALAVRVMAQGLVYQGLLVTATWCAARALGIELSAAVVALCIALVLPLTMLPISIAGFGVREGALAVTLGQVGVGTADATLISLITVFMLAVASLPGAIALAGIWRSPRASVATRQQ